MKYAVTECAPKVKTIWAAVNAERELIGLSTNRQKLVDQFGQKVKLVAYDCRMNGAEAAVEALRPTVAEAPQDPKPRPRSGQRSMVPLVPAVDVAGVDPPQNNLHAASDRAPSSVTRNGGEESGNGIGGTGPEESPPNSLFGMSAGTYYSESRRERIPIATMPTPHIERAASKLEEERAITESTIREPYIEEQLDDLKAELARRG